MSKWPYAVVILGVAAFLRIPDLADRPMHADEAVYAYKLGTLLESGTWTYEADEYHGPVLHYLTALISRLAGISSYNDLTEASLRIVPALLGLLVVVMPMLLAGWLGRTQMLAASALTAISPAMVYYSRYYIPEMLLTCLTAELLAVGYLYSHTPTLRWAAVAGLLSGLMFATKETALIAVGSLAVAALVVWRRAPRWSHVAAMVGIAAATAMFLLGPRETLDAMGAYFQRGVAARQHVHPWHYYLQLLAWWRPAGGWPWTEAGILILAAIGAVAAFRTKDNLLRFLVVYTISMTAVYSLIPYKTPWCLLEFLQPMILLAGVGLTFLLQITSGMSRIRVALVVAGVTVHLFVQAFLGSRWLSADPGNPYAYAHTTREVFAVRRQLARVAEAHEEGRNLPVQVVGTQNLWPLPWYLRGFSHVAWRRSVTNDMPGAPVILATPDLEPALLHHLYEVLPPGQRPLYVSLFDDVELRPGLPLRGYVQQSLAQ